MNRSFWRGLAAAVLLTGCAPTLDWRELRPEGSGLAVVAQDERTGRILASGRLAPHALPSPGKGWDNSPA